jgi:hypothetical protein
MPETLQLFGRTLPVPVWTAAVSVVGAIVAAVIGGSALLVAQYVGRQNLKLQIARDDRALKAQMERDDRALTSQMERDDRKRLQDARLAAYEAFFEKADLWSAAMREEVPAFMKEGPPATPVSYEEITRRKNEMIAASYRARLVAPVETVRLMIAYLGLASQAMLHSASDPLNPQSQQLRMKAERAHGQLTDAARKDVGNSDGDVGLTYQRVS